MIDWIFITLSIIIAFAAIISIVERELCSRRENALRDKEQSGSRLHALPLKRNNHEK